MHIRSTTIAPADKIISAIDLLAFLMRTDSFRDFGRDGRFGTDVIAGVLIGTLQITSGNLPIGFEVSLGEKNLAQHFAWHRGFARILEEEEWRCANPHLKPSCKFPPLFFHQ